MHHVHNSSQDLREPMCLTAKLQCVYVARSTKHLEPLPVHQLVVHALCFNSQFLRW